MSEPVAQPKTVVLNVNDSDDMRFAISAMLKRADFEVLEAATGEEALTMIESHEPHLVVLDVHLPGADGFEVCRRVRKNPFRGTMRILHTSAMSVSLEDKIESLEAGADGFLEQPFELEALRSCVRSLLDLGQPAQPRESIPIAVAPPLAAVPVPASEPPQSEPPASVAPASVPPADHLLQALEHIGDGMLCLDPAWRVTFVNAMAERVLGRKREELLGKDLWTAIPALEASTFGAGYRFAVSENVSVAIEGLRPTFNTWLQARALPTPQGLVVLFQDATVARFSPRHSAGESSGNDATFVGQRGKTLRGI